MKASQRTISVTNKVRTRGLTFIEVLIVVIIIGVLSGSTVPQFRKTFDNFELDNFAKNIFYLCKNLQGTAINEGLIYRLDIDVSKGEFQAVFNDMGEYKKPSSALGRIYRAPQDTTVSIDPPERTAVYFYPDGSVDQVELLLANRHKKQITLTIKGAAGAIEIK